MERLLKETLTGGRFSRVTPEHSRRMAAIRHKGNRTTERRFRAALVRSGVNGWQLHTKLLAGRPDFFFPREKLAIFVDGCFWHGCELCGHIPNKNKRYWQTKIVRNKERDVAKTKELVDSGIRVIRFWEHEIRNQLNGCVATVLATLTDAPR